MDPPLEFVDRQALRVAVAGRQEAISEATKLAPDAVSVTLERAGRYDPRTDLLGDVFTARQREVLETAVECGYYDTPRSATQADVVARLDCSAGTVGEHLRKIQARVLRELARGRLPAGASVLPPTATASIP